MSEQPKSDVPALNYEELFAVLPNAYIVIRCDDPDFTIINENQAHAAATLDASQDVTGRPVLDAFPDMSKEYRTTGKSALIESFRRVIKTKQPDTLPLLQYSVKGLADDYIEKWWRVTHYPLRGSDGTVQFIYQFTKDISDEIETSHRLALAQGQLDAALAIGLVSTFFWDIERDIVIGDKNLASHFGITPQMAKDGLPLKAFINSIYEDDRERVRESISARLRDGKDYEAEYRTVTRKGQIRWVIARGKVEMSASGAPRYFSGVLVDITDRKEAERRLEESRTIFDALFESRIVSIVMADLDGNIMLANRKFLQTFGYTQRDLKRGLTSRELTPQQSAGKTTGIYEELRQTGQLEPTEKEYIRKDGKVLPMLVGAVMLKGSRERFVAFMLDISETKELKALNVAKDEFVALASHQLRTPATSVKQYLGIVMEEYAGPVTADQLQYLNTAYDANERQLTIINDLLKTARLDTRGYKLNIVQCDLNDLIKAIILQFQPVCAAKRQQLLFTPHVRKFFAVVDREEISLALINLVENASKYTAHGKSITVTTGRSSGYACISITDEGVGIAKKDQAVIFEKFTRITNPLSDTVSGTGLGLYWVKRIIELHGGRLSVDSAPRKGTTFTVELPL